MYEELLRSDVDEFDIPQETRILLLLLIELAEQLGWTVLHKNYISELRFKLKLGDGAPMTQSLPADTEHLHTVVAIMTPMTIRQRRDYNGRLTALEEQVVELKEANNSTPPRISHDPDKQIMIQKFQALIQRYQYLPNVECKIDEERDVLNYMFAGKQLTRVNYPLDTTGFLRLRQVLYVRAKEFKAKEKTNHKQAPPA